MIVTNKDIAAAEGRVAAHCVIRYQWDQQSRSRHSGLGSEGHRRAGIRAKRVSPRACREANRCRWDRHPAHCELHTLQSVLVGAPARYLRYTGPGRPCDTPVHVHYRGQNRVDLLEDVRGKESQRLSAHLLPSGRCVLSKAMFPFVLVDRAHDGLGIFSVGVDNAADSYESQHVREEPPFHEPQNAAKFTGMPMMK